MRPILISLFLCVTLASCQSSATETQKTEEATEEAPPAGVVEIAAFTGQQLTGVTVAENGRVFINFPRWRTGVKNAVVEILLDQSAESYPDKAWNSWEIGQPLSDQVFVAVQSVVAFEGTLYVLDTRNPQFKGVLDAPRLFAFDLATDELLRTYVLEADSYHPDSYINDLRVDKEHNKIYFTDSGHAGLVVLDLESGQTMRVLNDHSSTLSEQSFLSFGDTKWENTVHADGIALQSAQGRLYYHALTAYKLYSVPTDVLATGDTTAVAAAVKLEATTAAPDGMIFDAAGNLYYADLEHDKIMYRKPDGSVHTLLAGSAVKWADTFSIHDGYLYYTNSRIHEARGDISQLKFTLNKVALPTG